MKKEIEIKKEPKKKKQTKAARSKQGKKNRAAGVRFEAKVRHNLEEMGWVVAKWMNNVDIEIISNEEHDRE